MVRKVDGLKNYLQISKNFEIGNSSEAQFRIINAGIKRGDFLGKAKCAIFPVTTLIQVRFQKF